MDGLGRGEQVAFGSTCTSRQAPGRLGGRAVSTLKKSKGGHLEWAQAQHSTVPG